VFRDPRRALLALSAVVTLATPGVAVADAPWTTPSPVSYNGAARALAGPPAVVANANDLALAVADVGGSGTSGPHTRASVYTNGVFLDPFTFSGQDVAFGPANGTVSAYGQSRLLAAGLHYGARQQAVFSFGRLTPNRASLDGRLHPLGPPDLHAHAPAMAVNAAGDAAIVYAVCPDAGCSRALVYLAVRRAGSSAVSSTRLADGSGPLPRVGAAINARGDALAVWSQASTLYARIRTAGGRLRARQRVGATARGQNLAPLAALSTHRGELVGWVAQSVSEGDPSSGQTSVARARDGSAFVSTPLSALPDGGAGHYVSDAGIRVSYDPRGRALVLYTAFDGPAESGRFSVRSAEISGAANSTAQAQTDIQTLSDPSVDTVLSDLVTGPAGSELALMRAGVRGADPAPGGAGVTVQAAVRGPAQTGPFSREQVSAAADASHTPSPIDGARLSNGRALATWATPVQQDEFSQRFADLP
jgi:hypothetical protein